MKLLALVWCCYWLGLFPWWATDLQLASYALAGAAVYRHRRLTIRP